MKRFFIFFFKLYAYTVAIFTTIVFIFGGITYYDLVSKNKNKDKKIEPKIKISQNKKVLSVPNKKTIKKIHRLDESKSILIDKKIKEWMWKNCKPEELPFLKYESEYYDLSDTINYIVHDGLTKALEFALVQIKDINKVWIKVIIGTQKLKFDYISVLDWALHYKNKEIIDLLKKYGAKTRCEILKENPCKEISLGRD